MENCKSICPECGNSFTPYNNRKNIIFCSHSCGVSFAVRRRREERQKILSDRRCICPWCNKEFTPGKARQLFCGSKCRQQDKNIRCKNKLIINRPKVVCLICHTEFISKNGNNSKYCSIICRQRGHADKARARQQANRQKYNAYQQDYRKRNNKSVLKHRLKNWYGITLDQYNELLNGQDNKCAICGDELIKPNVDHAHDTSCAVRGILCGPCNRGLGSFRDNPEILIKAAEYLRKHGK